MVPTADFECGSTTTNPSGGLICSSSLSAMLDCHIVFLQLGFFLSSEIECPKKCVEKGFHLIAQLVSPTLPTFHPYLISLLSPFSISSITTCIFLFTSCPFFSHCFFFGFLRYQREEVCQGVKKQSKKTSFTSFLVSKSTTFQHVSLKVQVCPLNYFFC